jgi:uncharacterized membrane protein
MVTGLFLDILFTILNYKSPLEVVPVLIFFNVLYLGLGIFGYWRKTFFSPSGLDISLTNGEKVLLIPPIIFPALSVISMTVYNQTASPLLIFIFLLIVPVYLGILLYFNRFVSSRLYPYVILSLSISLPLLLGLRSNHILGSDTFQEFSFFMMTFNSSNWSPLPGYVLSSCISISILPTIYTRILNVDPEYLFRSLYIILCSVIPLIVFAIAKKYLIDPFAFLASFFYMIFSIFLYTTSQSRTGLALVFFALCMFVIVSERMKPETKKILLILFIIGSIFSHYTTSYILFFFLIAAFIGEHILNRKKDTTKSISFFLIMFFLVFMVLWYQQIFNIFFPSGFNFISTRFNAFDLFQQDQTLFQFSNPFPVHNDIISVNIIKMLNRSTFFINVFFFAGGICFISISLGLFIPKINTLIKSGLKNSSDYLFLVIVSVCFIFYILIKYASFLFLGYGIDRLYSTILIVASVLPIIGAIVIMCFIYTFLLVIYGIIKRENCEMLFNNEKTMFIGYKLILIGIFIVIIIQYFSVIGLIYQESGIQYSILYNSPNNYQLHDDGNLFFYDQEASAALWLKSMMVENKGMVISDLYGQSKYGTQTGEFLGSPKDLIFSLNETSLREGYIYFTHTNTKFDVLTSPRNFGEQYPLSILSDTLYKKNLIYDNDISKIYY